MFCIRVGYNGTHCEALINACLYQPSICLNEGICDFDESESNGFICFCRNSGRKHFSGNSNNNQIFIVPLGRDFRGTGSRLCRYHLYATENKNVLVEILKLLLSCCLWQRVPGGWIGTAECTLGKVCTDKQ